MGYGFTAEYACNAGHVLEGNREVTCMEDGSWSAEPPTCSGMLIYSVVGDGFYLFLLLAIV